MADDQVKYSDLIADDVVKGLELLNKALQDIKTTMAGVKEEAASLGVSLKNVSTATREQQQATAQNAASAERLSKRMKDLNDEERKVEEIKRRYKKLTDEQIQAVNAFQQALRGSTAQQLAAVNAIDVESKSYNELNAMYNALKDSLNAMTIAERQNTEAGKAMTAQSARIYDTMNELQKSTGKYTLQVGKYRAAFDGLGYSFQQILREAPSALNLNQFFLAISNNIPMFTDQLKAFRDEQKEIRANLETMTKGTKEYIEQQGKLESVWKKLGKAALSWQSLILVGLMLLRKYGGAIAEWVKGLFSATEQIKRLKNEISASTAIAQFQIDVINRTQQEVAELDLIVERMGELKRGSKEWNEGMGEVNRITGENLNAVDTTYQRVKDITDEYKKQAIQIAKNQVISEAIGKSMANQAIREVLMDLYKSGDYESVRKILGYEADSDEAKNLKQIFSNASARPIYPTSSIDISGQLRQAGEYYDPRDPSVTSEIVDKAWEDKMNSYKGPTKEEIEKEDKRIAGIHERAEAMFENIVNGKYEVLSSDAMAALEAEMSIVGALGGGKKGATVKDKVADLKTLTRELQDAVIANMENEYNSAVEAEMKRHERFVEDKKAELELVKNDPERQAVINQQIEEDANTHLRIMAKLNADYRKKLKEQREKEAEEEEKQEKDNAKNKLKAAVDGWAKYKAKMVEEGKTRKQIVEAEVAAEIARLNLMLQLNRDVNGEIMSDEQKAKVQEWINLLERLQQTGNYGDYKPGQFMGKGGANVTSERKNYANIWEVLGIDMDNNQVSALNSVFDQAKAALNSWMDARKAAADQAKELADDEVSAAENALNREIELRNQGYANNVALKERELADAKERQKKAIEMQKKAKEEELAINTAMEASSMAVAIANLFKQFPIYVAIPLAATLLGAFSYAKLSALSQIRSTKYREGGVMLLEGGSHESGHDVNLGIGPDGSNLRAEGGEYFAVINKRNSRKYGSEIPAVVNALNSGMFEDRYIKTSDAVGLLPRIIRTDDGSAVDLSAVESGVGQLVKQGESRWTVEGEYRVERYKNRVRRVKIG